MKRTCLLAGIILITIAFNQNSYSQKSKEGETSIVANDLESYMSFLASPLLKGRKDGDESLNIAAQYISTQARLLGLKPANGNSYLQEYPVVKKTIDPQKSYMIINPGKQDSIVSHETFYSLLPTGPSTYSLEGDVLFAGYGIRSTKYNYNDFDSLKADGKIVLIMDRAPMDPSGNKSLFGEAAWSGSGSFQLKIQYFIFSKAKAILIVPDPKSGHRSIDESASGLANYLSSTMTLKNGKPTPNLYNPSMPAIIFVDRSFADKLLEGSGSELAELQRNIDESKRPHSFIVPGKRVKISAGATTTEMNLSNVAGIIEGRDPVLKNETVIFSAHYDHIGSTGDKINPGADDDASGCASLLSIAGAMNKLKKKPLRSVLFLWVSGEEVGLFGSESYVENPLVPLKGTVADLNMDMIGRVKSEADTSAQNPMTGPKSVFVITDTQSKDLLSIAEDVDKQMPLDFDYSLSGRNHPLSLFSRSDHFNFVKKDIPILFFSTGLHTNYHTTGDVIEKIDFSKMELITRAVFRIGMTVADRKDRIVVDNPYSSWGKK